MVAAVAPAAVDAEYAMTALVWSNPANRVLHTRVELGVCAATSLTSPYDKDVAKTHTSDMHIIPLGKSEEACTRFGLSARRLGGLKVSVNANRCTGTTMDLRSARYVADPQRRYQTYCASTRYHSCSSWRCTCKGGSVTMRMVVLNEKLYAMTVDRRFLGSWYDCGSMIAAELRDAFRYWNQILG